MSPGRRLSGRVGSLKDSVFSLCRITSGNLAEHKELKQELKGLVAELRLFGGAVYGLQTLICELEGDQVEEPPSKFANREAAYPFIDGCETLVAALRSTILGSNAITSDAIREVKAAVLGYRSKFGYILGSSETLEDISLHFTVLAREPIELLESMSQANGQENADSKESNAADHKQPEVPTAAEVSAWLTILNSEDYNREPAEYSLEKSLVQHRRISAPGYQKAASQWPLYAEMYWTTLQPQICSLFRIPKSYNFVQWVLEYARETNPKTFGASALSSTPILELTDALCDGTITSLHVAAALGLSSLCRELINIMCAKVNSISLLGSPLFCALIGPRVLTTRADPESWSSVLIEYENDNRADTVQVLLDKSADCGYTYHWRNTDQVSLASLAFWVALVNEDEHIYPHMCSHGTRFDDNFVRFLEMPRVLETGQASRAIFSRLLTYTYDMTLAEKEDCWQDFLKDSGNDEVISDAKEIVCHIMETLDLEFNFFSHEAGVPLDDSSFEHAVVDAIIEPDLFCFRRLTMDKRFDPNMSWGSHGRWGTILHAAVEGSNIQMVDIFLQFGADMSARDESGRTPLMVIGETSMLEKLVLDHGAKTTDADNKGRTIWHLAAATNNGGILRWLIAHDPLKQQNLGHRDASGHTPLVSALSSLRGQSCCPQRLAVRSNTIIPIAARMLLEQTDSVRDFSPPLLPLAIQWGAPDLVDKLLELGADPASGVDGYNAFMAAITFGHHDILSTLISQGSQNFDWSHYTFKDSSGESVNALQLIISRNDEKMLNLLLSKTPLKNHIDSVIGDNDETPLHLAVRMDNVACLQVLIDHDADLDKTNVDGRTPLHLAAHLDHKEAIRVIGANTW